MPYKLNIFTGKLDFYDNTSIPPGVVETLTGNSGGPVSPDGANNIDILGDNTQGIDIVGTPNTLTVSGINATESQIGVAEYATAAETTTGTSIALAVHPSGLNTKLGAQTANGLLYGQGGAGTNLGALAEASDGQLPIGNTGNVPTLASLTQPAAGITITGGPGSITFALDDDLLALENLGSVGFAVRSAANTWVQRSIAVTSSTGLSISNGNGVSGNPTLAGLDADTSTKGVVELATTAEVTTGSSTSLVPSVASMIGHEGIAKAWFQFDDAGGAIADSFNITSVTNSAAGLYEVVIATDFADANYSVVSTTSFVPATGRPTWPIIDNHTAGTFEVETYNMGAAGGTYTREDSDYVFAIAIGDQ